MKFPLLKNKPVDSFDEPNISNTRPPLPHPLGIKSPGLVVPIPTLPVFALTTNLVVSVCSVLPVEPDVAVDMITSPGVPLPVPLPPARVKLPPFLFVPKPPLPLIAYESPLISFVWSPCGPVPK